ncbi:peptidyl-prolyl cis-trans isomerase [Nitzschia inconspicua]|uniref:peptidylprolyl isomerase n=1 Tax=Nitzschia inconspicua TaxID=303405 RepID=A0A9K3KXD9_9STRA|nr:peptidyl-prolyl cis-trans isomerase [Nitzschia inconspicua]
MNSRDGSMVQQKEQQRISVSTTTRRQHLMTVSSVISLLLTTSLPSHAMEEDPRRTIVVRLDSSLDSLGVQVVNTQLRGKPVVAIQRVIRPKDSRLQPGMIAEGYNSAEQLLQTIQNGPYPLELKFINLAAGGDAFSDMGTTLVTPKDALELAQQTEGNNNRSLSSTKRGLSITTLRRPMSSNCAIQSRRGDVLEIIYEAAYIGRDNKKVVYDASEFRGTGQPYQWVLGNGDMIPGVDQGLYDMCPGEERLLDIPPVLGYSSQGTRIFRIPADYQSLEWTVHLMSIDTTIREDNNILSRQEREGRAL